MAGRALTLVGLTLVAVGLALVIFVGAPRAPHDAIAATLPGRVAEASETSVPIGPTATMAATPRPSTPTPQVRATPKPADTATPEARGTPAPKASETPTPTGTPQDVCPTAVPSRLSASRSNATPTPTATPTPRTCVTATPTRTPTAVRRPVGQSQYLLLGLLPARLGQTAGSDDAGSNLHAQMDYPSQLVVGDNNEQIGVTLSRDDQGVLTAIAFQANLKSISTHPVPVGTPGAPIRQALGPDYLPYAIAQLTPASGVDVKLASPSQPEQPLTDSAVTWYWYVIPQTAGLHRITLDLEVHYRRQQDPPTQYEGAVIWSPPPTVPVTVSDPTTIEITPFIKITPKDVTSLVLSGGVLALIVRFLVWIWSRFAPKPAVAPPARKRRRS